MEQVIQIDSGRVIRTDSALLPYIMITAHGAETFADEVWEQLVILLGTQPGEQGLDRALGIRVPIDELLPKAMAETEAEIVMKVPRFIQGIRVYENKWLPGGYNGQMTLKVVITRG